MTEYFLPEWWFWPDDPSAEIPPGIMAIACVIGPFGGGTEVIAGSMRGNTQIHSAQQAQAAARQHGVQQVNTQLNRQQSRQLNRRVNNQ